jgi:hypothetical protein
MFSKLSQLFWAIVDCFLATASNDPESYMEGAGNALNNLKPSVMNLRLLLKATAILLLSRGFVKS